MTTTAELQAIQPIEAAVPAITRLAEAIATPGAAQ